MFRAMHLSLLGCLLGTSGCHGLPPAPPAPSAAVGNYGEVIDYLQRHIRREMERQDVPGLALALVDDQQLVWARGFGYADRQHRINASEHTAFHAGDLSKLLIASATLQLAERGQLSLDAPLQDTLREFYVRSRFHADQSEADRAITFRRLLSHQSGLPGEHLPPLFGERPSSLGQLPAKVSGVWLSNPPGTQVAYSNLGYELVGAAIERQHRKALRAAHAGAPAGPFADDSLQLRQERPAPGATRPRLQRRRRRSPRLRRRQRPPGQRPVEQPGRPQPLRPHAVRQRAPQGAPASPETLRRGDVPPAERRQCPGLRLPGGPGLVPQPVRLRAAGRRHPSL
ncbi:beta-lactamase [Pseudomonas aeruginosa]|nr:beta-lactamase [Pseudomonas aeruginosa]